MRYLLTTLAFLNLNCAHRSTKVFADLNQEQVILLHGFGRSNSAMKPLSEKLEQAGYGVHLVGYRSLTQDMNGIKKEITQKINKLPLNKVRKVHFVGHSLGGLLIRAYLAENQVASLGNVVLLGSPNKGTPIVDHLKSKWWFSLAGPAVHSLRAGSKFLRNLKKPNYNLGVIAGNLERPDSEHILVGEDDGLVQVESTKVDGMKDFLVLPVGHSSLRRDLGTAIHTINFLRFGRFAKRKNPNPGIRAYQVSPPLG